MSDETMPTWGVLLQKRVAALEERAKERASGDETVSTPALQTTEADNARAQRQKDAEEFDQKIEAAERRLEQARRDAEAAEQRGAALATEAAGIRAEADKLALTRRVIELIWPSFMRTAGFADWKTEIEAALLEDPPPSSAALLFANLHGYTACLLENDQKYLRDVLRDISRFLYAWVKENNRDERAAFEVAQTWAAAFNEECAGRCEIEVPEPGTPANNLSMTFPPRGSSPEVASVRTWCVRDAQRRVIHRAEVFT